MCVVFLAPLGVLIVSSSSLLRSPLESRFCSEMSFGSVSCFSPRGLPFSGRPRHRASVKVRRTARLILQMAADAVEIYTFPRVVRRGTCENTGAAVIRGSSHAVLERCGSGHASSGPLQSWLFKKENAFFMQTFQKKKNHQERTLRPVSCLKLHMKVILM